MNFSAADWAATSVRLVPVSGVDERMLRQFISYQLYKRIYNRISPHRRQKMLNAVHYADALIYFRRCLIVLLSRSVDLTCAFDKAGVRMTNIGDLYRCSFYAECLLAGADTAGGHD